MQQPGTSPSLPNQSPKRKERLPLRLRKRPGPARGRKVSQRTSFAAAHQMLTSISILTIRLFCVRRGKGRQKEGRQQEGRRW